MEKIGGCLLAAAGWVGGWLNFCFMYCASQSVGSRCLILSDSIIRIRGFRNIVRDGLLVGTVIAPARLIQITSWDA
jgi:hypothetical protein